MIIALALTLMTSIDSASAHFLDSNELLALAPMTAVQDPDIASLSQRLIEIDTELSKTKVRWPTWSIVMTAVGMGGTALFGILGLLLILDGGGYGLFLAAVPWIIAIPFLLVGLIGVIGGPVGMAAASNRTATLNLERDSIQSQLQQLTPMAPPPPPMTAPSVFRDLPVAPLATVASF